MSEIVKEIARLFPQVVLTNAQKRAASRAANPADVAASLANQAHDIRRMFDQRLGEGIASDADVVARMDLSNAIGGYGDMSDDWLFQEILPSRILELGQASRFGMRGLYHKYIGAYHPEGADWWEDAFVAAADRDGTLKESLKD